MEEKLMDKNVPLVHQRELLNDGVVAYETNLENHISDNISVYFDPKTQHYDDGGQTFFELSILGVGNGAGEIPHVFSRWLTPVLKHFQCRIGDRQQKDMIISMQQAKPDDMEMILKLAEMQVSVLNGLLIAYHTCYLHGDTEELLKGER